MQKVDLKIDKEHILFKYTIKDISLKKWPPIQKVSSKIDHPTSILQNISSMMYNQRYIIHKYIIRKYNMDNYVSQKYTIQSISHKNTSYKHMWYQKKMNQKFRENFL